jgi:hypothetical protein
LDRRDRTEVGEATASSIELRGCRVVVAQVAERATDEHTRAGYLVGRVERRPELHGLSKVWEGCRGITSGERNRTRGVPGHRGEGGTSEGGCDGGELLDQGSCLVQVTSRVQDLDGAGQEVCAVYRVAWLGEQATDGAHSGRGAALGEPEQRQRRLGVVPEVDRLVEGGLGSAEVSSDVEHLPALAGDQTKRWQVFGGLVTLRGAFEFFECGQVRTTNAHDLPAVHRTLPGEWQQPGLGLAPGRQRPGPLGTRAKSEISWQASIIEQ